MSYMIYIYIYKYIYILSRIYIYIYTYICSFENSKDMAYMSFPSSFSREHSQKISFESKSHDILKTFTTKNSIFSRALENILKTFGVLTQSDDETRDEMKRAMRIGKTNYTADFLYKKTRSESVCFEYSWGKN